MKTKTLKLLWSSTKATQDQAIILAEGIKVLGKDAEVIVIKLTDTWWGVAGDKLGEIAYAKLQEYADTHETEAPVGGKA